METVVFVVGVFVVGLLGVGMGFGLRRARLDYQDFLKMRNWIGMVQANIARQEAQAAQQPPPKPSGKER